ncbi:hypothetical protein NDU88_006504 [Pleurodeles waltl]|uniref:Uncharacterized protein n=1 Tax=Pleurodeles waltl TaxID=8319 RepID=A0AAV7MCE9_PLEWA|nr:hypothetical protein NDU88_006504 [Pleurodeles waltl]
MRFRIEETPRLPGEVENKQRSCRVTSESVTKQQVNPTRVVESDECFVLPMNLLEEQYSDNENLEEEHRTPVDAAVTRLAMPNRLIFPFH